MPTVSQGSLPDMAEEVLGNFSAILESMDFAQELELLGIRKLHFRQRKRAIRELRAMGIGLWRLGLKRSFPSDGEFLFERFMLGLYEQAHTNKEREQANAFDLLVRARRYGLYDRKRAYSFPLPAQAWRHCGTAAQAGPAHAEHLYRYLSPSYLSKRVFTHSAPKERTSCA